MGTPLSQVSAMSALSTTTDMRQVGLRHAHSSRSPRGRRTLITRLAERGIDLKSIAEIAGHTSIRTTTMYIEANPKRLARILQDVTW
jgi:site-specific recombinase XerD